MSAPVPYAGAARRGPDLRPRPAVRTAWSPERLARLIALRAAGLTASQCGDRLGCSRSAVLGALHRQARQAPAADRPAEPLWWTAARALRQAGATIDRIAAELDRDPRAIRRVLTDAALERSRADDRRRKAAAAVSKSREGDLA